MGTHQTIHAAVLHAIGQTPRYEPFPAGVGRLADGTRVAFFAPSGPTAGWPSRRSCAAACGSGSPTASTT